MSDQTLVARVAWSRLAEPCDARVADWMASLGPVAALEMLQAGALPGYERYAPRLEKLSAERDLDAAARLGLTVLTPERPGWPKQVDDLPQPPVALWVRGDAAVLDRLGRSVAVVGARAATSYGVGVAHDLGAGLAERGFAVVSGAAFGIDVAAHRGVLAVGGTTLAVLAGGAERAYPAAHAQIISEIAATGCVVSEVPPGSAPTRVRFLRRNRLIAALTGGTVVVEAGLRSGALNTARHAESLHRPVGAVPGPVTSMASAGCHQVLRDGLAQVVTDAAEAAELCGDVGVDLCEEQRGPSRPGDGLDEVPSTVLSHLPVSRPVTVAALAVACGLSQREVVAGLGTLASRGLADGSAGAWQLAPGART